MDALAQAVLQYVAASETKVSFGRLRRHFCVSGIYDLRVLKRQVSALVQEGVLCYTYHYGRSFIECAYDRPRFISNHVVLKPPRCAYSASPGTHIVSLERGAAFGGGEHPTTRLCIHLMDEQFHLPSWRRRLAFCHGLDIGTGSGVLAIVAAKMGVASVHGLDTDPCAVYEARVNVGLNKLTQKIQISGDRVETISGSFDVVFANLRLPTLIGLTTVLKGRLRPTCAAFLSGVKDDEMQAVIDAYAPMGFFPRQKCCEKGWGAVCLTRGDLAA